MIQGIPFALFASACAAVFATSAFWLAFAGPRTRVTGAYPTLDLLRTWPIGRLLRWRPFRVVLQVLFAGLFLLVIVAGLFGNQQPGSNAATVLTWTYWWILLTLFAMLLGKAWCYVCPWDALAGWLQRLSWWGPGRWPLSAARPWPKALRNLYPAATLFLVLTWLELGYGVTMSPALTAVLALLMFFLTFVPALLFERSSFCRYGCLVGRISGLYALFAPIELRASDRGVCQTCRTRDCFHGNANGSPCPTSQYLGGMTKNTYCILCGECVFTCPHDNVSLNLRPPAADLFKPGPARSDEAAMVLIMLSMSTFHGATMTPAWQATVGAIEAGLGVPYRAAFTIGMAGFLAVVVLLYVVFVYGSQLMARTSGIGFRQLAVRFSYAFVPIALFYHLAHNTMHFAMEGGALIPLVSNPFGWSWNLFGTAAVAPGALLPLGAVGSVMVVCVLAGHLWGLAIAQRVAASVYPNRRTAILGQLPIFAGMTAYSIVSLWLVAQPMMMRTAL